MNTETRIHCAVVTWWDLAASGFGLDKRCLVHAANGGKRKKSEAAILCGMGVRPGFPDLMLLVPKMATASAEFHGGLMIEVKSPDGRVSADQRDYLDLLQRNGYSIFVAFSFDEAVRAITSYLRSGDPLKK